MIRSMNTSLGRLISKRDTMYQYWLEALLMSYLIAGLDLIITARGILIGKGIEGNFLVTTFIPNGHPFQIPLMLLLIITIYWLSFAIASFYPRMIKPKSRVSFYQLVTFGFVASCITHMLGIVSWII